MQNLSLEEFTQAIMDIVKSRRQWGRVVSLDLETKVLEGEFLSNERILAAGIAYREGGIVKHGVAMLDEETDESEFLLLKKVGSFFTQVRPLVLLGYNISGYDYPLISTKLKQWGDHSAKHGEKRDGKPIFPQEYWALKDALTRSYILDLMHVARFAIAKQDNTTPKYLSLEKVIDHPMFAEVPLMRKKHLAGEVKAEKGKKIYEMWKNNDQHLSEYLNADVHDTLLIAEKLFGINFVK
ncbi:hypothetical protein COT30_02545 [Candidatus Micrarchaeota archaeon CG08_land_8_20_14_0_20_49_17]|nr:MAG: hypothetical protein AUJ13_02940 [Candidatus Micrarchaeota archaeon CG1_02_49_24]PIU09814.1 MAG: hypothetical protein COT30_02545 [Candidatus Micrarchaeota archaeon CG08_land_8_20_14_0_20_49_17]PIZ92234.1 MAG: hypothetical protein COX84_07115 [Candidatus Micrarchaeota archaeon CG_4_10_14_0_2_um_filter_49_7]HII53440.1 hypothetical protein [Candidatus Micrarchaeota archaeon]